MPKSRVAAVAKTLGVSTTSVYNHISRLKGRLREHLTKEDGATYLDDEGVELVRQSIAQAQGAAHVVVSAPPAPLAPDMADLKKQLEGLGAAFLSVVEELRANRQESAAIRAEVSELRRENQAMRQESQAFRLALLPPPDQVRQVIPWHPKPKPDPLGNTAWWYRAIVRLVDPARFRRYDS